MSGASPVAPHGESYFRQLLSGRDLAVADPIASQMVNFVYAVGDRTSGNAILVDPAYAPGELIETLADDGMKLVGAVLSHYHADHAGGVILDHPIAGIAELLELVDVPVHVQRDELEWVRRSTGVDPASLVPHESGDVIAVGSLSVTCVHTPGHTPGSQCLLVDGRILTGDTLFLNGCGRTDLPGGDAGELYESLTQRLAAVPAETAVYPGHAYDRRSSAPIADVRATNSVLVPSSREEWLARFGA